jgi:two-component system sensor histidine kinase PhoQ
VSSFRRSLWGWLLGAALVLLVVQGVILRWSLDPLRKVAREVQAIESGQQRELSGNYPQELRALTTNLNVLIRNSQVHLERYRNALADLAHSLKTPLAVLRGIVESNLFPPDLRASLWEQMERMNRTVDYQLQRAAVVGRTALKAPVPVESVAGKVMGALAKVYAQRSLQFHRQIDQRLLFYGEEGDLFEILGNLTDNACKWARSQVVIRAFPLTASAKQTGLFIEVEDDGPGIPDAQKQMILQRGKRADPNISGHGIGLAMVRDIVEEVYRGTLEIAKGSQGGACIRVSLQWS